MYTAKFDLEYASNWQQRQDNLTCQRRLSQGSLGRDYICEYLGMVFHVYQRAPGDCVGGKSFDWHSTDQGVSLQAGFRIRLVFTWIRIRIKPLRRKKTGSGSDLWEKKPGSGSDLWEKTGAESDLREIKNRIRIRLNFYLSTLGSI